MNYNTVLENISDGVLYELSDVVLVETEGCMNCSDCCHGVGEMVQLTPFDVFQLSKNLNLSSDDLFIHKLELRETGKIKLPHLKMTGPTERCIFLNELDRCDVHAFRPNICRLFPLGRVYLNDDFKYCLLKNVCGDRTKSSVAIEKWIDIENYEVNKEFLLEWYRLLKALTFRLKFVRDAIELEEINMYLRHSFYQIDGADFYKSFFELLPIAKSKLGII